MPYWSPTGDGLANVDHQKTMRIAIFQLDVPLQSYSRDLANILAELGHSVTLCLTNASSPRLIDSASLRNVRVCMIDRPFPILTKLYWKITRHLQSMFAGLRLSVIDPQCRRMARKALNDKPDLLIGIEKRGLVIAGMLFDELDVPFVYYSLELYIEGHPWYQDFCQLRRQEIQYHRKALATIVQDRFRAEVLMLANGNPRGCVVELPIGVRRLAKRIDPDLRTQLGIKQGSRMVLSLGSIAKHRLSEAILDLSDRLDQGTTIILHGPTQDPRYRPRSRKNVIVSNKLLPESELASLISLCDMGLVVYRNDVVNDRLTAFSSQKVAYYLALGKPIVTIDNESYRHLFAEFACGETFAQVEDIPRAIEKVSADYERYAKQALAAFEKYYCLDNTIPLAINEIRACIQRRRPSL